jgi:hypothetical protein
MHTQPSSIDDRTLTIRSGAVQLYWSSLAGRIQCYNRFEGNTFLITMGYIIKSLEKKEEKT